MVYAANGRPTPRMRSFADGLAASEVDDATDTDEATEGDEQTDASDVDEATDLD